MEFTELIKKRHCVRKFDPRKKITQEQLNQILEVARLAPSEGNIQPWFFIIIKDQKTKQKITETNILKQTFIKDADVLIVICINLEVADSYGERGLKLFSIQSTAVAAEHIFLAAVNLGLGACWIGAFDEDIVKKYLNLEEKYRPVVIMPIGYSAEKPFLTDRKNLAEVSKIIE
jgi:nitroreductase